MHKTFSNNFFSIIRLNKIIILLLNHFCKIQSYNFDVSVTIKIQETYSGPTYIGIGWVLKYFLKILCLNYDFLRAIVV
jgi:hypothetical protein